MDPSDDPSALRLPSWSVADALRATSRLYRQYFGTFALVMGIMALPFVLSSLIPAPELDLPPVPRGRLADGEGAAWLSQAFLEFSGWLLKHGIAVMLVDAPIGVLASAPAVVVSANLLRGRPANIVGAFRATVRRLPGLAVLWIITVLAVVLPSLTLVGILVMPYIVLGLTFLYPVALFERADVIGAIGRSWDLSRGHRWRLLKCLAVIEGVILLASLGPWYALHWWTGVSYDDPYHSAGGLLGADAATQMVWVAVQIIQIAVQVFLQSLPLILTTVLYFDLRAREAP